MDWAKKFEETWTDIYENKPDEKVEAFLREITMDVMAQRMKEELCGECSMYSTCATCKKCKR